MNGRDCLCILGCSVNRECPIHGNAPLKPEQERLRDFFLKSRGRMARLLLEANAPDVIIANEARILLGAYHGGHWRAIRHWMWKGICREASNVGWAAQVQWYRLWHNVTDEEAADVLLDRIEQKESKKGGKHA